jgi:general secretion pathway protein G
VKKGFTLIELLVVLVVIGVLIGLILPNTLKAIKQANNKECASNLRSIDTALQMCYSEHRDWDVCQTVAQLTEGHYLDTAPVCPFGTDYAIETPDDGGRQSVKTTHFNPWPATGNDHVGN